MQSEQLSLIHHEVEHALIQQRAVDGYIHATAMCKAAGKRFNHYYHLNQTRDFLKELSSVTRDPGNGPGASDSGGNP